MCVKRVTMRSTVWIWFVGCVVWIFDGVLQAHYHAWLHARLAFTIALLFLIAGVFYQSQRR